MILFKLAVRNIFRHSTRSLITLSAIAFGSASIILVDGFFDDLFYKMREGSIRQTTGHLQLHRRGFSENGVLHPYDYMIENPAEIVAELAKLPEVDFVTPRIEFSGLLSTGENNISFFGISLDPEHERMEPYDESRMRVRDRTGKVTGGILSAGKTLEPSDSFEVLLGHGLASSIGAKEGADLVVMTNTVAGSMNAMDVKVKGTFRTATKEFDDRVARLSLKSAQELLRTESVQSIIILLERTENTELVGAKIQTLLAQRGWDLEMKYWYEISDFYLRTKQLFGRFFMILIVIIAIVVILSIFNTMNMAVLERTGEIGTLRSLGNRKSEILELFILEGFILGVFGALLGAGFGSALTETVGRIGIWMPPPPGGTLSWISEPKLTGSSVLLSAIIAVCSAVVSSILPARKAAALAIADALRHTS